MPEWKLDPRRHLHAPIGYLQGNVRSFRSQGNSTFQNYGHTTLVPLDLDTRCWCCRWFQKSVVNRFLNPEVVFFLDKARLHWVGIQTKQQVLVVQKSTCSSPVPLFHFSQEAGIQQMCWVIGLMSLHLTSLWYDLWLQTTENHFSTTVSTSLILISVHWTSFSNTFKYEWQFNCRTLKWHVDLTHRKIWIAAVIALPAAMQKSMKWWITCAT